jgi:hypothetical protein
MCGCIGNGSPAVSPARLIILRTVSATNGPLRSVVKMY